MIILGLISLHKQLILSLNHSNAIKGSSQYEYLNNSNLYMLAQILSFFREIL